MTSFRELEKTSTYLKAKKNFKNEIFFYNSAVEFFSASAQNVLRVLFQGFKVFGRCRKIYPLPIKVRVWAINKSTASKSSGSAGSVGSADLRVQWFRGIRGSVGSRLPSNFLIGFPVPNIELVFWTTLGAHPPTQGTGCFYAKVG